MHQIPSELIANFTFQYTMDNEGATRVEVTGKDDERQSTLVLEGSLSG